MTTRDITVDGVRYITFGECICDKYNGDSIDSSNIYDAKYHCPHHGGHDGMGYCRPCVCWAVELLRRDKNDMHS